MTRTRTALLFFACAAFVAYLSFVPFRFQPLAFDEALTRFSRIPYLDLGAGSRADWVANILMFLPLGWLAASWFVPHPRRRFDIGAIAPALLLGSLWAVVVEFAQLYFPNRTVSINDIVAEVLGSFLGAWLWSAFGARGRDWWHALLRGGLTLSKTGLGSREICNVVVQAGQVTRIDTSLGTAPVPGDFDGDGDSDLNDLPDLVACLQGPGVTYPGGDCCLAGDADGDFDVDLRDAALIGGP